MKFCTFTLIDNSPDPITGERLTTAERFAAVVRQAEWAEELGFDGFGVRERHAQRFISSSPPVVLAHIAAATTKIRLPTPVTVLSLLDPVRVAEVPIRHGSASSTESTELAAQWGDPLFSANGFHPMTKYAGLIDHYRQRWVDHGRDPVDAVVGAGFNGLYIAKTSQEALDTYRPVFDDFMASPGAQHNRLPFGTLEEFLEQGSVLVGSPEQVIDKFGRYHAAFGHELSGIAIENTGLPTDLNHDSVERFVGDVLPVPKSTYPSRVWSA